MSARRDVSAEPFSLAEVQAITDVYEALHGADEARKKIRQWAAPKTFTEAAYAYVVAYIESGKN